MVFIGKKMPAHAVPSRQSPAEGQSGLYLTIQNKQEMKHEVDTSATRPKNESLGDPRDPEGH
jgi:hypothetical protein